MTMRQDNALLFLLTGALSALPLAGCGTSLDGQEALVNGDEIEMSSAAATGALAGTYAAAPGAALFPGLAFLRHKDGAQQLFGEVTLACGERSQQPARMAGTWIAG